MLLYGVGRTSFTPQIRRHSSAGQSARFTSVRSWVQVPLSPPKEKGAERCLFLLVQRHLAQPNAALYDRASLQRKLVWLAGAQSRQCFVPPHTPSRRSKVRFAPASFFACGRKEAIRPLPCSSFSAKGHARLACSAQNALATAHSRYHPFAGVAIQTDRLPQKRHPTGCLFLLVQRQGEFASLYVWYLPSLPKANSLACRSFALAMLRQAERRSLRKVSVTVPSLASSGPE